MNDEVHRLAKQEKIRLTKIGQPEESNKNAGK